MTESPRGRSLAPLGLAALLLTVPIVVLYLIRRTRRNSRCRRSSSRRRRTPAVSDAVSRTDLTEPALLLQVLVVLVLAVGLATPYVTVSGGRRSGDGHRRRHERVMQTDADGQTRFRQAVAAARDEVMGHLCRHDDQRWRGGTPRGTPTAAQERWTDSVRRMRRERSAALSRRQPRSPARTPESSS
ncbi:hypothetical protein C8039_06425 [Halogeometricum sp. wsp3]|nr:hypothetical protein C8039_06425 [Halogeometricum sp. wsp3]